MKTAYFIVVMLHIVVIIAHIIERMHHIVVMNDHFIVIIPHFIVTKVYRRISNAGVYLNSSFKIESWALAAIIFRFAKNPIAVPKLLIGFNHQI